LDLEIALSGASAKVQPHGLLQPGQRAHWNVGWRNRRRIYQHSRQPSIGL